jgi:hypothetical protein
MIPFFIFKKLQQRMLDSEMQILAQQCLDPNTEWWEATDVKTDSYINYSDNSISFSGTEVRPDAYLCKTPKGCMQPPHIDRGRDYSIYVPIYPNMYDYSPMTFYQDNKLEIIDNLDPGAMYLVNHNVMHSAFNFTDYDRFNLQLTITGDICLIIA